MAGSGILINFTEWVRRVSGSRTEVPPVPFSVQPVVLLGDHSQIVSPMLGPMAYFGGAYTSDGVSSNTLQIASRAPGGTFIHEIRSENILNASTQVWGTRTDDVGLGGAPIGPLPNECGDGVTLSRVFCGSATPFASTTLKPQTDIVVNEELKLDKKIYIPPGSYFYMAEVSTLARLRRFSVLLQDVLVTVPSA